MYGSPPFSVALIHGGPGAPGEMAPVARELSSDLGVLEPLQSEKTIDGQVEELREVLETNAKLPVILVGYSWGAWLSFIFAARYPKFVRRLILISCLPFRKEDGKAADEERLRRLSGEEQRKIKVLMEGLVHPNETANEKFLEIAKLAYKADAFDPITDDHDLIEAQYDIFQSVWKEAATLREHGELLPMAQKIACPVVAIHGAYDPHPYLGVKEPLSQVLNDVEFILLEKCGHKPWNERFVRDQFYKVFKQHLH